MLDIYIKSKLIKRKKEILFVLSRANKNLVGAIFNMTNAHNFFAINRLYIDKTILFSKIINQNNKKISL